MEAGMADETNANTAGEPALVPVPEPEQKSEALKDVAPGVQPTEPTPAPEAAAPPVVASATETPPLLAVPPKELTEKLQPGPAPLTGKDFLHGGNAILAAQTAQTTQNEGEAPATGNPGTPFDRNLREAGLREALQRPGTAPPKVQDVQETGPDGTPRIRTYAADMSEEIRKRGAALSTIIAAEQERPAPKPLEAPIEERRSGRLYAIAAVFLLLLGGGIASAAFLLFGSTPASPALEASIIPLNERGQVAIASRNPAPLTLAEARATAKLSLGEIEGVTVTDNGAALSPYEILTALGAPDALARNATGVLVGLHQADHVQPFLLVSVSAYDTAFGAMLSWEGTIGDSLGNFFAPSSVPPDAVATHAPPLFFTDNITQNLDVRQSQSAWPILYTFPRRDLLLITTNQATVREVLSRLSLQGATR
jgi:hypothetical protein